MRCVFLAALVLAVAFSAACRKRTRPSTEPVATTEQPASSPPGAPSAPAANTTPASPSQAATAPRIDVGAPGVDRVEDRIPSAPAHSSKSNPVDRALTEALQRYNEANGKMPNTFQVLVTDKYLKALPNPPAGKFYALDRPHMQVVLINQ